MSSENKGADQLRSNCEADLLLCFCIGKSLAFSQRGSFENVRLACKLPVFSFLFCQPGSSHFNK